MKLIEAPNLDLIESRPSLYLAGNIVERYWRPEIIENLSDLNITILNPWPVTQEVLTPSDKIRQAEWEHHRIRQVSLVVFWFCDFSVSPMSLFELGALLERSRPLVIGIQPGYEYAKELKSHIRLRRPKTKFHHSISELCRAIRLELKRLEKWTD